jgi:hypothetical protein
VHLKIGACRITDTVKAQKLRGVMKNSEKTTYEKSYHSHLPRAAGGTFFPAGGGVCGLGSVGGGGGVDGRRLAVGGGEVCCLREGRRASSGLLSSCWCCGGGGGAPLCPSASAVFWRLGAGSATKEPSPR